jgi:hypothetical protein
MKEVGSAAALLGVVIVLGMGLLYLMGWGYATAFYGHFGVGLVAIEIPREYFFIWGWLVLTNGYGWALGFILAPGGAVVWRHRGGVTHATVWFSTAIAMTALGAMLAHRHGGNMAGRQLAGGLPDLPAVQVLLADSAASWGKDLNGGCWRLLVQDKSRIWLLRPIKGGAAAWPAVDTLPLDNVARLRLLPGRTEPCD